MLRMVCHSRRVRPENAGLMAFWEGAVANSTGAWGSLSTLMRAAVFALAYYLGAKARLALVVQPEQISALWPANPVAIAVVLLSPTRIWPAYFVALFSGLIWAALRFGPRGATG